MSGIKTGKGKKAKGNPFSLCTWNEPADCEACGMDDVLACRWDQGLLAGFFLLFMPFGVMSWFGLAVVANLTGAWLYLVVNGAFYIAFFLFFEIRILCSHCPYYAEEGRVLHCLANNGAPKLWRYHPEPMNRFERISLVVCFIFLGAFPVLAQAYGIMYISLDYGQYGLTALLGMIGITAATLLTAVTFFSAVRIYICPRCVNFSCPLNAVPRPVVDAYLEMNPVMKEAWEKSGYQVDDRR